MSIALFDEHRGWLQTPLVVWCVAGAFAVGWSIAGWWMFHHWLYSGYDLAIFDQVVWNTSRGDWFAYSFNPYSYLGDHREWILVLLAPLYWVIQHPVVLVVVQAFVVALTVVPLYRIGVRTWRCAFSNSHEWYRYAYRAGFGVVALFLVNPSVHALLIYEFHALTLSLPAICWLWDSVQRGRFGQMWIWVVVILLIRDDIALVVMGIGLLLWCVRELPLRRRLLHGVGLIGVGVVWFAFNQWIGSIMHPEGVSKFFVLFKWMGDTPLAVALFALQHPLQVLSMFFQFDHLLAPLFFIVSVGGLILLRPRLFIPALFPLVLLFIDRPVGLTIVKFHYSAFIIPWLIMASAEGLVVLARWIAARPRKWRVQYGGMVTTTILIGAVVVFQSVVLSPFRDLWVEYKTLPQSVDAPYKQALSLVGPNDAVMASRRLYTRLAHRTNLYPTLHTHTGLQHFSTLPSVPPERVDWLLLESDEVFSMDTVLSPERREGMGLRFQSIIDSNALVLRYTSPEVVVYGPAIGLTNGLPIPPLPQNMQRVSLSANKDIRVTGWGYEYSESERSDVLWLEMQRVTPRRVEAENLHASIQWRDGKGAVIESRVYLIGTGVHPTTEWRFGDGPQLNRLVVRRPSNATELTLRVGPVVNTIQNSFVPFIALTQQYDIDPDNSIVVGSTKVLQWQ